MDYDFIARSIPVYVKATELTLQLSMPGIFLS